MKLVKEVFDNVFCSAIRPNVCLKQVNICCLLCDLKKECLEKNKEEKSKVLPCQDEDDQACDFLV